MKRREKLGIIICDVAMKEREQHGQHEL